MDIRVVATGSSIFPWAVTVNGLMLADSQFTFYADAQACARTRIMCAIEACYA
jgi:D-Tyr-tRNAtyr deacylase